MPHERHSKYCQTFDTDLIRSSANTEIPFFSPIYSPGIFHNPVLFFSFLINSVPNNNNCVVSQLKWIKSVRWCQTWKKKQEIQKLT